MVFTQKYSEAPKMLNQASMLQHFVIPTASNGSPLKALHRRDFARGESLEQKRQEASGEKASLKDSACLPMFRIGCLFQRPLSD
jgi:hypothetical protein